MPPALFKEATAGGLEPHRVLLGEIHRLKVVAEEWTHLFPQAAPQGRHWLGVLEKIQDHLAGEPCRLAVVGTVKSGKSTLINALVGRDLLKRGAGIVTAIITRVQPGPESRAVLIFKDWGEINGEINQSLGLFPSPRLQGRTTPLDLKIAGDRELLAQVLSEADAAATWPGGSLDQSYILLKSYLEGYDLAAPLIPAGGRLELDGEALVRHQEMVSREATAVYLKDVLLTVPFPWEISNVEWGDCQGSDSPMPQHLAQVLQYLFKTDLALYVISSRVGLRQADFQFLGELKRMGLAAHTRFILNLDLGEHRDYEEVIALKDRLSQDLQAYYPGGHLYAFSALQRLFRRKLARGETLAPREAALFSAWEADQAAASFSAEESDRFEDETQAALKDRLSRHLGGSSLAQVRMVAQGLRERLTLTRDLMVRDQAALEEVAARIQSRCQPLADSFPSLRQTLEGAALGLKKELKNRVSSQMDPKYGPVGSSLLGFMRSYEPDWEKLPVPEGPGALRPALYHLFQEFHQDLARFVAGQLNVAVWEFIQAQEEWLRKELAQVWTPLLISLQEALSLYYREIAALGLEAAAPTLTVYPSPRPKDLEVPLLEVHLNPGWRLTGEAWVQTGVGWLRRVFQALKKKMSKGAAADPKKELIRNLSQALKAIKEWMAEALRELLLDYGERLKFQYFSPLVDHWLTEQESGLKNTLGSLVADFKGLAEDMRQKEAGGEAHRRRLEEMVQTVLSSENKLAELGGGR
jgi:hypothetical protein